MLRALFLALEIFWNGTSDGKFQFFQELMVIRKKFELFEKFREEIRRKWFNHCEWRRLYCKTAAWSVFKSITNLFINIIKYTNQRQLNEKHHFYQKRNSKIHQLISQIIYLNVLKQIYERYRKNTTLSTNSMFTIWH